MSQIARCLILFVTFFCISVNAYFDKVIMTVNDHPITQKDLKDRIDLILVLNNINEKSITPQQAEEIKRAAIESLIGDVILEEQMSSFDIVLDEDAVRARIADIETARGFGDDYFAKLFKKHNLQYKNFLQRVKTDMIKEAIMNRMASQNRATQSQVEDISGIAGLKDFAIKAKIFTAGTDKSSASKLRALKSRTFVCDGIKNVYQNMQVENIEGKLSELDPILVSIIKSLKIGEVSNPFEHKGGLGSMLLCTRAAINNPEQDKQAFYTVTNVNAFVRMQKFMNIMRKRAKVQFH